jgi:hypothetical protein
MRFLRVRKDHAAAALIAAIGACVAGLGLTYQMGTLNQMGAGFMPVVYGVLMVIVGAAIGLTARRPSESSTAPLETRTATGPEWRGWLCIVASVVAFVVLGSHGGLVPATFVCVFVAAQGDRNNTWRSSSALAAIVLVFTVAVFHYGLQVQLPLFQWL